MTKQSSSAACSLSSVGSAYLERYRRAIWIRPRQCASLFPNWLKNQADEGENNVKSKGIRALSLALAAVGLLYAAAPAMAQEKITVWWGKGFYKSEDDALLEAIKKFEAKTGIKVELSQYAIQDMIPKTVAALDSGTVPDVAYSDTYDVQAAGKWAFEGKLEDLSDILMPMKSAFAPNTLETAYLYNDADQEEGLLRLSAEAAEHARPDLEGHAGDRPASSRATSRPNGRITGRSGATRCSRRSARPRHAHLRRRPADGRGIHQLVPVVLHLHGRLQRQAGRRRRQAPGRRSQGAGGPDPRAEGLHRSPTSRAARRPPPPPGRIRTTTSPSTTRPS